MSNTIQSSSGQVILSALIDLFSSNGNEMSLQQIHAQMPEMLSQELNDGDLQEIDDVLRGYSSSFFQKPQNPDHPVSAAPVRSAPVLLVFEDMGEDLFRMNASEETLGALQGMDGFTVSRSDIPARDMIRMQRGKTAGAVLPELAAEPCGVKTWQNETEGSLLACFCQEEARLFTEKQNRDLLNSGEAGIIKETAALAAEKNSAQMPLSEQRELRLREQMHVLMRQAKPEVNPYAEAESASGIGQRPLLEGTDDQEAISDLPASFFALQAELDDTYKALGDARDRAEAAEADSRNAQAQKTAAENLAASLRQQISQTEYDPENLVYSQGMFADPLVREICKNQDQIAQQQRRISDHEIQIEQDSAAWTKSLRRSQIRRSKKAIDTRKRRIARLRSDMLFGQ